MLVGLPPESAIERCATDPEIRGHLVAGPDRATMITSLGKGVYENLKITERVEQGGVFPRRPAGPRLGVMGHQATVGRAPDGVRATARVASHSGCPSADRLPGLNRNRTHKHLNYRRRYVACSDARQSLLLRPPRAAVPPPKSNRHRIPLGVA